ncbi:ABC transporter substrate-binding protein [Paenibacillus sinopodophylli]|uniref:ABC transporter substrate-binding protein n=1 Tax=Paenibacillus sinopodophylli TaxID=1837342 RepID=UPI00110C8FA4|nr:ABC transporter substrate-binding protein [Paenibacillus sinopodophylli]
MINKKRYLSVFLGLFLMIALLAACGGNNTGTIEAGNATPNVSDLPEEEINNETRSVVHNFGTTDIPANPKRIASINLEDMLLTLDVPLVLATPILRQDYLNSDLEQQGAKIESFTDELNFEAVIAADPDLIIASSLLGEEVYSKLSSIAPTIAYNRSNWRTSIVQIGEALNLDERAQQVLSDQEAFIAAAKQEVSQLIGEQPTAAFLRMQEKDARLFLPSILSSTTPMSSYVSIVYEGLGWQADPFTLELQKANPDKQNASISLEVLPEVSAEHLFVVTLSSDGSDENLQKTLDNLLALEDTAVWGSIPAVIKGNVHVLNMKNWLIEGPKAEQAKLNELIKVLKENIK